MRNEWEGKVVMQKPLINNYEETIEKYGVGLFRTKTEEGYASNIIEGIKREPRESYNTHVTINPKN